MKRPNRPTVLTTRAARILAGSIFSLLLANAAEAQLTLSGTSYLETFDGIVGGLPLGWTGRTGATAASLGTAATAPSAAVSWSDSAGAFKNFASATGLASNAAVGAQSSAADRAFGIRQTGAFGDPGAAFTLEIANTVGFSNFALTLDLEMLSVQTRSTVWTVQYGIGATPSTFTDLFTYSDPGSFGTTTTPTLTLGADANNSSSSLWIRIVALAASNSSGSRDSFGIDQFNLSWASAAPDRFWDANGAGAGIGGSGSWDTTSSFWNTDPAGVSGVTTYSAGSKATFGGTAGTVTIAVAGVAANAGIQFDTEGYTINGPGTLTVGVNSIVTTHAAGTVSTINAPIAGSAGLSKSGPGTLELTAANTFTGTVTIGGGRLKISADNQLGAATNDLQFAGGGLEVSEDLALAVGRDLTGGGTIDVASGKTLTINGSTVLTSLVLSNDGTVAVEGATKTVGDVTFTSAGTLASTGTIQAGTINYASSGSTAFITANLDLGSSLRTVTVADGAENTDLTITGSIKLMGGNASRLHKLGTGTLRLEGDNGGATGLTGSLRIGTAGTGAAPGGTVVITNNKAMGDATGIQVQFNAGVLRATSDMTGVNAIPLGLSIGSGDGVPVTFAGSPMEFAGASSFFKPTGVTASRTLRVETDLILRGELGASSGTGSSSNVMIDGAGSLTLAAALNAHELPVYLSQAALYVNGELSAPTATVYVENFGRLGGSGMIAGGTIIAADGILAPGTAATPESLMFGGTLDISIAAGSTGPGFEFRLGSASDSVVLTSGLLTIGAGALEFSDFAFLAGGGFGPGTYTLFDTSTALNGTLGSEITGNIAGFGATLSVSGDGQDLVLNVVPEPGSAMLLLGGLALISTRRRRAV